MVTKNQNSVTDTHRRERNPNITLKIIIKSQGKRRNKEGREGGKKGEEEAKREDIV